MISEVVAAAAHQVTVSLLPGARNPVRTSLPAIAWADGEAIVRRIVRDRHLDISDPATFEAWVLAGGKQTLLEFVNGEAP